MTKWKNLAGKFTDRQIDLIEKFQKKYGFENSNQMVRVSIIFMIRFIETMLEFADSEYAKKLDSDYKKLQKEVSKFPSVKERIQPVVKKMDQNLTKTLKNIIDRKDRDFVSFTEKRKVGRPKATKKPPGRPKDEGI
ncbi:MAG: hypothetical protein ACREAK_07570 [Nitrosarchaeum sp.]